jgi:hypothetical protein
VLGFVVIFCCTGCHSLSTLKKRCCLCQCQIETDGFSSSASPLESIPCLSAISFKVALPDLLLLAQLGYSLGVCNWMYCSVSTPDLRNWSCLTLLYIIFSIHSSISLFNISGNFCHVLNARSGYSFCFNIVQISFLSGHVSVQSLPLVI